MSAPSRAPGFDPRQPFSRAEARAAGLSVTSLLSSRYRKILYDSYILASVPVTTAVRARAALLVSPAGSHVSHHTAVTLWGADPPETADVHVSLPSSNGRSVRKGIRAHVHRNAPVTAELRGLRVSSPVQAFLELATVGVSLVDLVVVGDGLVKRQRIKPVTLLEAAKDWRGPGRTLARRAAALVRAGVDSAMETRLRMLLVLAGLPEPKVNVIVRGPQGEWRRRFDLCYEQYRVIVEYDGRQHAEDDHQWQGDILRREDLDRMGWRLVIVISRGIYREPLDTLERVRAVLLERGATDLPRYFDAEWRRHFAVRRG